MAYLKTNRTILRSFQDHDLDALIEMMSDIEIMKYTGFRSPKDSDFVKEKLKVWKQEADIPLGIWCAESIDSSHFIGWFMLKDTGKDFPELGFMLAKDQWGHGYAVEVCKGIIKMASITSLVEHLMERN